MSHIAQYSASLKGVDRDLLKKALDVIAKKFHGKIGSTVYSMYEKDVSEWDGKKILASIKTKELPDGLGLALDKNNNLTFVGESAHNSSARKEVIQEIEYVYKILAHSKVLGDLGYSIQPTSTESGTLLEGEKE